MGVKITQCTFKAGIDLLQITPMCMDHGCHAYSATVFATASIEGPHIPPQLFFSSFLPQTVVI